MKGGDTHGTNDGFELVVPNGEGGFKTNRTPYGHSIDPMPYWQGSQPRPERK